MPAARCLIVVASVHHGNTARVARAMADVLDAEVVEADEIARRDRGGAGLAGHGLAAYDLVGFGSGVYYGRMHASVLDCVRALPEADAAAAAAAPRPAFVFSTSGLPVLAAVWHAPLTRLLARKGFDVVGAFACRGFDTWGPLWLAGGLNRAHPDARDLRRAREFAARLAPRRQRASEGAA